MRLMREYVDQMKKDFEHEDIRLCFIGSREPFSPELQADMEYLERVTAERKCRLCIAVNYGGRAEITHAVKEIAAKVKSGELSVDEITESVVNNSIYTAGQPDPDIIVRPSGEYRLSNFMTWQSAYSEFWYSDVLWPDFTEEDVNKMLFDYQKRNRRFGGV